MAIQDAVNAQNGTPTTTPENASHQVVYRDDEHDIDWNNPSTRDGQGSGSSSSGSDWSNDPNADFSKWNGDVLGYYTYMAKKYGGVYIDYLNNWILSEGSTASARQYNAEREDSAYQRMFEDWKKAGINPYLILQSGASPVQSASSTGYHYSGSGSSSVEQKEADRDQKWAQLLISIFSTVMMCAMVMA